ncbi:hypothetical protein B0T26DRAFT_704630 [Lasiosphaeria miniovina]|uniref:Uncharacterized protein n=1 Tax=Lasiosphaeria miniovina TaxID=1954250 RepID=A0AA40E578_9PEZI|nr:uncharacterized protein B0T26DRAFT_704630 [Lasiosphaeria miniovina]KAK0722928.1 hypothetical protein B0T26DRAFT_704630 [Lasiosphaeria miniovina]
MSCSTDHDHIYAYLGLANDVCSPFTNLSPEPRENPMVFGRIAARRQPPLSTVKITTIHVDYDEDAIHVYADFAERMLEHKDHLELLHCAGAFRPHASSSSISRLHQTWAPN